MLVTVLVQVDWSDRVGSVEVFASIEGALVRARELLAEHGEPFSPVEGGGNWVFLEGASTGQLIVIPDQDVQEDD